MTKINRSMVVGGGEVDFTSQYQEREKRGRVSLRYKDNRFEVYVYWFNDKTEQVLHYSQTLADCIEFTNARFGLTDTVG